MFFFVVGCLLCWIRWLDTRSASALTYAGALGCYLLALLSKESAVGVVPLCVLVVLMHPTKPLRKLWGMAPFVLIGGAYFGLDYASRQTHLHFNDGTFSLSAPFVETVLRSMGGLLWVWGAVSLPVLFTKAGRPWRPLLIPAAVWMAVTLLPYSFLTYMPRVPSRHTYLASVGLSFIVAAGLLAFHQYARRRNRVWLVPFAVCLIVVHQTGYLWIVKHRQYAERAWPTEELLSLAGKTGREIHANCFPFTPALADLALKLRLDKDTRPVFVVGPVAARYPDAVDLCNADADGVHY